MSFVEYDVATMKPVIETIAKVVEFAPLTKTLACGGCSKEMTVSIRTVLAYCPACSAGLGVKK